MRATRILEMARSIGLVMSEEDKGEDLLAAVGQKVSRSSDFDSFRKARLAEFQAGRL